MRNDVLEQAKAIRATMDKAGKYLTDTQALECIDLYAPWVINTAYALDDRVRYNGKLYKCITAHTSQADWTPDLTPALWVVINTVHAGTLEDPIPASRGMEYEYGKYYLDPEDGKIYICSRGAESGTIVLQFLPHELIGHYFTEVTNS